MLRELCLTSCFVNRPLVFLVSATVISSASSHCLSSQCLTGSYGDSRLNSFVSPETPARPASSIRASIIAAAAQYMHFRSIIHPISAI
jgi:hypothetical protein